MTDHAPHAIHVTGFDSSFATELRCEGDTGSPCWTSTDHENDQYVDMGYCLAAEWIEEVGDLECFVSKLEGPPPWPVRIVNFDDDGPTLEQVAE